MNAELTERLRCVRLLVMDVDGVMTDGGLYYDASGLTVKRFDVQDGIGVRLLQEAGIELAVISGMDTPCVLRRLEDLGITRYHGGHLSKAGILENMRRELDLAWDAIAYIGDDWVDLAPMRLVGVPVAVSNARPEVKAAASFLRRGCWMRCVKNGCVLNRKPAFLSLAFLLFVFLFAMFFLAEASRADILEDDGPGLSVVGLKLSSGENR